MSRECESNYHITRRVNKVARVHAQTAYFVPCFFSYQIRRGTDELQIKKYPQCGVL